MIVAVVVSALLLGLSQPLVLEAFGPTPIDATGLTGLLAMVGYVPALMVASECPRAPRAFWIGFGTATGHLAIVFYWLVIAMHVFGGIPTALAVLALLALSAFLGAFVGVAFAATTTIVNRTGWPRWLVFGGALTAVELARNFGPFGGFPWGNVGYAMATVPLLLQSASLWGVFGLVALIGATNGLIADIGGLVQGRCTWPRVGLLVLGSTWGLACVYGGARLDTQPAAPSVRVGLLQGNVEQGIKNNALQHKSAILAKYHHLQTQAIHAGADLVVWPEAALPGVINARRPDLRAAGVMPRALLGQPPAPTPPAAIIGAVALEYVKDPVTEKRRSVLYNTAIATGADLEVLGRFDKTHLVPFGEYVPWPLSAVVSKLVPGAGRMRPGSTPAVLDMPVGETSVRVGTTICYEGVFPEISRALARDGAGLLVNVTNDAWYGVSSAPFQHLNMYALRAVETDRAFARATNTGVSAWVDPRGHIHSATDLYAETALVADVPVHTTTTTYVRFGDWLAYPWALVMGLAWLWALLGTDPLSRPRPWFEWACGVGGLALSAAACVGGVLSSGPGVDGARATQVLIAVLSGLLVGMGALSGRPWGRRVIIGTGAFLAVVNGIAVLFGVWQAGLVAAAAAAIATMAYRRRPRS